MPGDQQLHLRVPQEKLERYKEAAKVKKMSLTTLVLGLLDAVSDNVLSGKTELVGTSTTMPVQPAQVQREKVQTGPSGVRDERRPAYGPDMPIGEMTSDQIRRYLAALLADEAEEEQRRLEREQFSNWD
jgi:hypothetical protein